jgi:hypothetical protein
MKYQVVAIMSSVVERKNEISKSKLSSEFYLQSLLDEAYKQGVIDDVILENIQIGFLKLLAESIERYNKGNSSSVQTEVAQAIMASNLYTISLYLKSLPDLPAAIEELKSESVENLYRKGLLTVERKLKVARHLYQLVCMTQIQSDHYFYNTTISDDLKKFFEQYNKDFEAHDSGSIIDYQLMNPDQGLVGIEYVISYLNLMSLENIFCAKFEPEVIHKALLGYKQTYKDLPVNIFEQVLLNALGCVIANQDIISLNFSASDRQRLKRTFNSDAEVPFCDLLEQAAVKLIGFLNITSKPLQAYIHSCIPDLVMSF